MSIMIHLAARFAFWFAPFLFIVSAVAPLAGQRLSPRQPYLAELGFAACRLPCWAGITPGVTPFAEANELLAEHLPAFNILTFITTSNLSFQTITSDPMLAGVLYYSGARVSEVHLDVALPAWYLFDTMGTPDCVSVSRGGGQIVLSVYWEHNGRSAGAYFVFERQRGWQRNTLTRFMQMTATLSCDLPGMLPWKGFARIWRYEEAAIGLLIR